MNYDAIIEQLRAWATTLTNLHAGDHGNVSMSTQATAQLAGVVRGMHQMADDLEVH